MLRLVELPVPGSSVGGTGAGGAGSRLLEGVPLSEGTVYVFGTERLKFDDGVPSVELLGVVRSGLDVAGLPLHAGEVVVIGRDGTVDVAFDPYGDVLMVLPPSPEEVGVFNGRPAVPDEEKLFGCPAGICWTVPPCCCPAAGPVLPIMAGLPDRLL